MRECASGSFSFEEKDLKTMTGDSVSFSLANDLMTKNDEILEITNVNDFEKKKETVVVVTESETFVGKYHHHPSQNQKRNLSSCLSQP